MHDIEEDGPYTTQAANVLHLRSDFNFTLPEEARIGNLLRRLHPTPAVCGLPKEQTFDFIRRNESAPRRYYSGFTGPLNLNGDTHLFVSLRCMQIAADGYRLYAGGGLLRDSDEEQEWRETESKLEAMKRLIV
jgi:isochorismate synthase